MMYRQNKNLVPLKDLERNHMRRVWRPQSCYICLEHYLNLPPNTWCLQLYKTKKGKSKYTSVLYARVWPNSIIVSRGLMRGQRRNEEGWGGGWKCELILQHVKAMDNDTMDTAIIIIVTIFWGFRFSLDLTVVLQSREAGLCIRHLFRCMKWIVHEGSECVRSIKGALRRFADMLCCQISDMSHQAHWQIQDMTFPCIHDHNSSNTRFLKLSYIVLMSNI